MIKLVPITKEDILAMLAIAISYVLAFFRVRPIALSDPDQYMHLAIARLVAEQGGLINALPQADNLGWKTDYPNPYPLFHTIAGLLYKMGGLLGVKLLVPIVAVSLLLILYLYLRKSFSPALSFLLTLYLILIPDFLNRLIILRPFLFGISLYMMMLFSIMSRRPILLGLFCALYCLSYHLLYIPGIVICMVGVVEYAEHRTWRALKMTAGGLIGLTVGIILDPTFPNNIVAALITAHEASNQQLIPPHLRPIELFPLSLSRALRNFGGLLAWYPITLILLIMNLRKKKSLLPIDWASLGPLPILFCLSLFFWGLCSLSMRAIEYSIPTTVLYIGALLAFQRSSTWLRSATLILLAPLLHIAIPFFASPIPMRDAIMDSETVQALPIEGSRKKVLNCEWYTSPHILYHRPTYRFVDINDPTMLAEKSPEFFSLRESFRSGKLPYPFGVARFAFDADYVLCSHPNGIEQLELDPHFDRIFPASYLPYTQRRPGVLYLYKIAEQPSLSHVFDFEFNEHVSNEELTSPSKLNSSWKPLNMQSHLIDKKARSPYLNLSRLLTPPPTDRNLSHSPSNCVTVRPTAEEMRNHQKTDLVGLGGGPEIRLWWNGKMMLTASPPKYASPRMQGIFIELPRPLNENDQIEATICSENPEALAFSLSLMTKNDLVSFCKNRGKEPRDNRWDVKSGSKPVETTCLGSIYRVQRAPKISE